MIVYNKNTETHTHSSTSRMPSSIETLAQTSIKHISMTYAREILMKCSQEYGFDFDEACTKFFLREADLPVPLFDHAPPPPPPAAKDDMISNLLTSADPSDATAEVSAPSIPRKRAGRLSPTEKAEQARMKEEERLAKKVAKEAQKKATVQARAEEKQREKQAKLATKAALKAHKGALKFLPKIIKMADQANKANKANAPKRPPSAYLIFSNENRSVVKSENPQMPAKLVMSELAKRWKALTDEQKQPYQLKALKARTTTTPSSPAPTPAQVVTATPSSVTTSPPQVDPLDQEVTVEEYAKLYAETRCKSPHTRVSTEEAEEEEEVQDVDEVDIDGTIYLVDPVNGETFDRESHELVGHYNAADGVLTHD